jgi:hypothetical protein
MVLIKAILRRTSNLAARSLKPLNKGDPEAKKPVYVDGIRVFPPTIDENGNVTYHQEFPAGWKPFSYNYLGHGWLIGSQMLLWGAVFVYWKSSNERKELL